MSGPTEHLRALATRLAQSYVVHSKPRAILLAGSAASGGADLYSDLDLLCYYDGVPSEEALAEVRLEFEADRFKGTRWPEDDGYSERYYIAGIQCQIGHASIPSFEREIVKLLVDLDLDEVLPKIMGGLFDGLPLFGADLIEQWRRKAAYTESLQRAMIQKQWKFFPWWHFEERLRARDTTVWRYDVLVQSAYNLVAVLAALNRLYFSNFEFKRASKFLSRLEIAPPNLASRLEALFESDEPASTAELERLVSETAALVSTRFPDIDLALEWGGNQTPPGSRESPWRLDEFRGTPSGET
jgi:predicted nucleotidyltransferase